MLERKTLYNSFIATALLITLFKFCNLIFIYHCFQESYEGQETWQEKCWSLVRTAIPTEIEPENRSIIYIVTKNIPLKIQDDCNTKWLIRTILLVVSGWPVYTPSLEKKLWSLSKVIALISFFFCSKSKMTAIYGCLMRQIYELICHLDGWCM